DVDNLAGLEVFEPLIDGNFLAVGREDARNTDEVIAGDPGIAEGELETRELLAVSPDALGEEQFGGYVHLVPDTSRSGRPRWLGRPPPCRPAAMVGPGLVLPPSRLRVAPMRRPADSQNYLGIGALHQVHTRTKFVTLPKPGESWPDAHPQRRRREASSRPGPL